MKRRTLCLLRTFPVLAGYSLLAACSQESTSETTSSETVSEVQMTTISDHLQFDAPDASWSLETVSAFQVKKELWIIHQLKQSQNMAAQVITPLSADINLSAPEQPIKHFVLGKTWSWKSDSEVIFIDSMDELNDQLSEATPIDFAVKEK